MTSLTQQFAVLLLAHPLAALLDDRTHLKPPFLTIEKIATCPMVHRFGDFAQMVSHKACSLESINVQSKTRKANKPTDVQHTVQQA